MNALSWKAVFVSLCLTVPGGALAQEADANAALANAIMASDGTGPDAGATAETGWLNGCTVERTGAGWGNHYVALTCPSGPFTNRWHLLNDAQKDAMLATALAAMATEKSVQVYISPASSGYNTVSAFYLTN